MLTQAQDQSLIVIVYTRSRKKWES